MFYTQNRLSSGKIVRTVINEHNVFTHCPECCEEVFVDLGELMSRENFCLYDSRVFCDECTADRRKARERLQAQERQSDFAFVPENARGCMTDEELDDALSSMGLSPAEERAVREVCKKGFVYAPELKEKKGRKRYEK